MAAAKKAKKAAPKKAAKKKVFQIHNSGAAPQGSAPVLSARRRLHVAVVGFAVGFIEQCLTSSNDAVPMMTVLDCNHPTSFDRFRGPQQHGTYCPGRRRFEIGALCLAPAPDRKSTRLNSSHQCASRMPSSA